MSASCAQCVRVRLAVPEAIHQIERMPGIHILGREEGSLDIIADAAAIEQLRGNRLVREVSPPKMPAAFPERLEPWAATIGNGLVELLHQPAVQLGLLALFLRFLFGGRR